MFAHTTWGKFNSRHLSCILNNFSRPTTTFITLVDRIPLKKIKTAFIIPFLALNLSLQLVYFRTKLCFWISSLLQPDLSVNFSEISVQQFNILYLFQQSLLDILYKQSYFDNFFHAQYWIVWNAFWDSCRSLRSLENGFHLKSTIALDRYDRRDRP